MAKDDEGWFSRERALTLVLVAITCLGIYICYRVAVPFLPALAWGSALAIVAHPMHSWLELKFCKSPTRPSFRVRAKFCVMPGPIS